MNTETVHSNENESCAFLHRKWSGGAECSILNDWYTPEGKCRGCPFFKTAEQVERDKKIYPNREEYKK